MQDGACHQARAVLAVLSSMYIEGSYQDGQYQAQPDVARWENCREQGYVISLKSEDYDQQLNIAFFEHRNSDEICAIKWEQRTLNSPTIDTAVFNNQCYKDKYDVSYHVDHHEFSEIANWIQNKLEKFWRYKHVV